MPRSSFFKYNPIFKYYPGFILAIAFATAPCHADITMNYHYKVDGGGMMSMFATEGTVNTAISGSMSRTDSTVEGSSGMLSALAKNAGGAQITRLDKELMWQLYPNKQQYSELSFAELRTQIAQGMQQMASLPDSGSGSTAGMPVSEGDCQWSGAKVNVEKTGETARIADIKAKQYVITYSQTCSVPEREMACEMNWQMENWMATRMPGDDEAEAFQQALAEQMGSSEAMAMGQAATRGLLALFRNGWRDVEREAGDIKGYPVKTIMSLEMGGEDCITDTGKQISMDDVWAEAGEAGMTAATDAAAAEAGYRVAAESAQAVGGGVGGAIAGSAVGAVSRELVSGMFKKFGKKKKQAEGEAAAENAGKVTLFRISNTLESIDESDIQAEHFDVPDGWEKIGT